ncbi:hypothetical protein VPHK567_0175 [Vibrio phage K567]
MIFEIFEILEKLFVDNSEYLMLIYRLLKRRSIFVRFYEH